MAVVEIEVHRRLHRWVGVQVVGFFLMKWEAIGHYQCASALKQRLIGVLMLVMPKVFQNKGGRQ